MMSVAISDNEFARFRGLINELAGIHLSDAKKALVSGRLGRRLRHHGMTSYGDYFRLIRDYPEEQQIMVDLLTTNETYFFREPRHFDFLRDTLLPDHKGSDLRVWSAASSSGQEPYSLAMLLADEAGRKGFHIDATDISSRVLEAARRGIYPLTEAHHIPAGYLEKYCLRGVRSQDGKFLVKRDLRKTVSFRQLNLNGEWRTGDRYDVIFLRNVMIYFERETKAKLVSRLAQCLHPGGYLIIGHSETLNGFSDAFRAVMPSVYRLR